MSGWMQRLAADAVGKKPKRACILLWMNGGPSQMDTFDLKPGHANGGTFKEIATAVPGIKISEHLPKIAAQMKNLCLLRGMATKEGDHGRATYYMRTGYVPLGAIEYPTFGSLISKELGNDSSDLPNFVSIAPVRFLSQAAYSSGFLGPQYSPLMVGDSQNFFGNAGGNYEQYLKVADLEPPAGISRDQAEKRVGMLKDVEDKFITEHPGLTTGSHRAAYEKAVRLMKAEAAKAFELKDEPAALRDKYGKNLFGQGCLLARRLVERGVPFVEVTLSAVDGSGVGWDTHQNNFDQVKALSRVLDPGFATLIEDLKQRGLLDTTTVVWAGEFGRTPRINPQKGRDHFSQAWTTVIGGGGIKGGQVIGKTSPDGMTVTDRPTTAPDLLSTVARAIGVDPMKVNMSNVQRPIRIVDKVANPIGEVLA
ncbi:MAG: DUF1501 domain-containing protein [Gemmataceae bacterium]